MEKNITFEAAIARIEQIVASMEKGNVTLEETVAFYKEGMDLAVFCSAKLRDAKLTIEEYAAAKEKPKTKKKAADSAGEKDENV